MKSHILIPAVFLSLTSINALADGYNCQKITGQLSLLTPDAACHILLAKARHFPDTTFIAEIAPANTPNICFSGQLTAKLGNNNKPISGTSYSGLTQNSLGQLTAASAIQLNSNNIANTSIALGKIYTKDVVINPLGPTSEILTMVDGSNTFNGGHGELEITGNALFQAVSFTGQICTENE